jgi:sugar phosphate isomerase/epimerase
MKFAMPIWYGDRPLQAAFEKAHRIGFDYIEFSLDYPWPDELTGEEMGLLGRLGEEYGLGVAFHGPWAGKVISHPRDEISDACMKIYERCLRFAGKFNPLYFNFHQFGYAATRDFEEIKKRIWDRALGTTRAIVDMGRRGGFPITVENNEDPFFGNPRFIEFLLEKIDDLNFCLDVGHAMISRWEIQRRAKGEGEKTELWDWFNNFRDRIFTVHLHDCLFKGDSRPMDHLVIGKGNLDFEDIAKMIKKTNCRHALIETYYKKRGVFASEEDLKSNLEFCRGLMG